MRRLTIKSLPCSKEWLDKDIIMLHACFQLLEDFVEQEKGDIWVNYETHKDFVDEVRFLYNWWKERKKSIFVAEEGVEGEESDDEMLKRLVEIRRNLWT